MTAQLPSINDTEFSLLKKIANNTAALTSGTIPSVDGIAPITVSAVTTYSQLPVSLGIAPIDSVILVVHSQGVWPISDHSSGFYIRRGTTETLADWESL